MESNNKKSIIVLSAIVIVTVAIIAVVLVKSKKEGTLGGTPNSQTQTEENQENISQMNDLGSISQSGDYSAIAREIEKKKSSGTATSDDLVALGVAYYNLDDLDKAEENYNDSLAQDPNNPHTYLVLGNVLRDKRDYRGAEENYRKALTLDSSYLDAYFSIAVMHIALENDKSGAVAILQEALANNPGNETIINLLNEYQKL